MFADEPQCNTLILNANFPKVVRWIQSNIDELDVWKAGGIAFAKKKYIGSVIGNQLRVRALSSRRDEASGFLLGTLSSYNTQTRFAFRIELPNRFMRSLPWVAILISGSFGYVGYRFSHALPGAASLAQAASAVWFTGGLIVGLAIGVSAILFVNKGVRADQIKLEQFVKSMVRDLNKME